MSYVAVLVLLPLYMLTACTTPAQRRGAKNAATQKEAAQEITRICSLPEADREAAIKKVKEESGMVIFRHGHRLRSEVKLQKPVSRGLSRGG
jgi:hypothetical protein